MTGLARIGAHQERHQVGAHGMGDPGLVAVDLIDVAVTHRPGPQRGEIGAGIGLGEHRRRQNFAGSDLGQPFVFLLLGAAARDQFGGDLGTRAQRADPDITARELLGDDAHGFLAEPQAAIFLRDGEPEHAELRHLRQHFERDVAVGAMPADAHGARPRCRRTCASRRGWWQAFRRARNRRPWHRGARASARSAERAAPPGPGGIIPSSGPAMRAATPQPRARDRPAVASRPDSWGCRPRSGRDIRRCRARSGAPRYHRARRGRASARHRRQAGAVLRHRSRARPDHGWRAARGQTAHRLRGYPR